MSELFYEVDETTPLKKPQPPTVEAKTGEENVYLPPKAIVLAMQSYTKLAQEKTVLDFGIPQIDARVSPLTSSTMAGFLARPGMGKTMEMLRLAAHQAKRLRGANPEKPKLVVFATWETSIEELVALFAVPHTNISLSQIGRGTADLQRLREGLTVLLSDNICLFGVSTEAERQKRVGFQARKQQRLEDLYDATQYLAALGHEVGVIFMDYLQAMPDNKGHVDMDNTTSRVMRNVRDIKDVFCNSLGLPCVVGIQADRKTDDMGGLKLPTMNNAQWASAIEQYIDKMFSLTMPAKYLPVNFQFIVKDPQGREWNYEVTPQTRVIQLLKQRYDDQSSGDTWVTEFNPRELTSRMQPTLGECTDFESVF